MMVRFTSWETANGSGRQRTWRSATPANSACASAWVTAEVTHGVSKSFTSGIDRVTPRRTTSPRALTSSTCACVGCGNSRVHRAARHFVECAREHDQHRRNNEDNQRVLDEHGAGLPCAVGKWHSKRDDVVPAEWQSRTAKSPDDR